MNSEILSNTAMASQSNVVTSPSIFPKDASSNTTTIFAKTSISLREERSRSMSTVSLSDISDEAWNQTKEQLRSEPSQDTPAKIKVVEPEVSCSSSSIIRSP